MTDGTTLTNAADPEPHEDTVRRVPALTVLAHPVASRIGQRATLSTLAAGARVALSRRAPGFATPGALWDAEPLDDPYISRRSWQLEPDVDGDLTLRRDGSTTALRVDEVRVDDAHPIASARLDDGVVLELGNRVALLLHRLPDPPAHRPALPIDLVGDSERMAQVHRAIARVAALDVPVLVRGETGTGKELVARALHRHGRAGRPFVAVSLGALTPSLAAAELFGSVKGAYTGAAHARAGHFRAADGGTLFLDEIGEAPGEVQAMLLRVLETRQVVPVGAQTPVPVDVRLVAATDAPLEARAAAGAFRTPLLHRLAAYEIWLPPLRHRRDDIGRLFLHFAREASAEMTPVPGLDRDDPGAPAWLPSRLMARLARYDWPGNVRQLRNVVRQMVIDAQGDVPLRMSPRLERLLVDAALGAVDGPSSRVGVVPASAGGGDAMRPVDVTPEQLEAALRSNRFEPAAAARQLGISRPSMYRLIREHPRLQLVEDLDASAIRAALREAEGVVAQAALRLGVSARALGRRVRRVRREGMEGD
ncbi:MAG: sigma 54-interacting transcriptional regulator [Acidobacteriota bacterium]